MAKMATMGYGNVITDDRGMVFTSVNAATSMMKCMMDILGVMATDMSKLTGIPVEFLMEDYICETGNDIGHEIFKDLTGIDEPTPSRERINRLIEEITND